MSPYRSAPEAPRTVAPRRAFVVGDRVRVVAADAESDPAVREHGNEAGTVVQVFPGGAVLVAFVATGRVRLLVGEWLRGV